jgi:hypothetical protein
MTGAGVTLRDSNHGETIVTVVFQAVMPHIHKYARWGEGAPFGWKKVLTGTNGTWKLNGGKSTQPYFVPTALAVVQACKNSSNNVDLALVAHLHKFTKRLVFVDAKHRPTEKVSDAQKLVALNAYAAALIIAGGHRLVHIHLLLQGLCGATTAYQHMRKTARAGGAVSKAAWLVKDLVHGEQHLCNRIALLLPYKSNEAHTPSLAAALQLDEASLTFTAAAAPAGFTHPWRIVHQKGREGAATGTRSPQKMRELMDTLSEQAYARYDEVGIKYGAFLTLIATLACAQLFLSVVANLSPDPFCAGDTTSMDIGATRIAAFPWPVATSIVRVAALALNGGRMAADLPMSAQMHAEELAQGFMECFHALEASARGDDGGDDDDRETANMVAAYVQQSIIAAFAMVDGVGGTRHEEINSQNHHATNTYGDAERTSIDKMRLLGEPLQVQAQRYVRCGIACLAPHVFLLSYALVLSCVRFLCARVRALLDQPMCLPMSLPM